MTDSQRTNMSPLHIRRMSCGQTHSRSTWRFELLTENWEPKKPLTMAMMVSVTYFSRHVSACFLSVVLIDTYNNITTVQDAFHPHSKHKSVTDDLNSSSTQYIINYASQIAREVKRNRERESWCHLTHPGHVYKETFEEFPNVIAGVDLLHLHLSVHIAVVHEIYICYFYLQKN